MNWNTAQYLYGKIDEFYTKLEPLISDTYPHVIPVEYYIYKTDWIVIPYKSELKGVSEDGFTVYKDGKYNIFMRDSADRTRQRSRFTMAHEIGHIILDHHKILGGNLLTLNPKVKNYVEFQANTFAENILMPIPHILKIDDKSITNLSKEFNVSKKMVEVRLMHIQRDYNVMRQLGYLK
ncbi:MAG: ImmA/IrrE family metallo-endopeptidase [Ezakiella coagulans]|uniref:ImmA/IrrE family metallo-endopeptidase n=1 Tax=Ezakiella coagulans TaxID=46507 RepID=UPI003999D057